MGLFSFFSDKKSNKRSNGVFIPDGASYQEVIDISYGKSINEVTCHLGFSSDQLYIYMNNYKPTDDIVCVAIKIFTKEVVYVMTKDTVTSLKKENVDIFLRSFSIEKEFDSYNVQSILESGIKNKSLTIDFLAPILKIEQPEPDGVFNIASLGLNLCFSNGYLTEFFTADGLNQWAKGWREINPKLLESYENEARHFWGSNISKVIGEINAQADAYANTPDALLNTFISLHQTKFGNVNFVMLLVCHYNRAITMTEFIDINHGRFNIETNDGEEINCTLGNFNYTFSANGSLLRTKFKA